MIKIDYSEVVEAIINNEAIKATKFISPKLIVRATRKLYGKKIIKNHNIEITLTIGKPNWAEREFIKLCEKSGEPFPIKKVQLKLYNLKYNKLRNK